MTVTVTTHWCGGEEPAAAATSALNHPALVLFADQISDSTAPLAPHNNNNNNNNNLLWSWLAAAALKSQTCRQPEEVIEQLYGWSCDSFCNWALESVVVLVTSTEKPKWSHVGLLSGTETCNSYIMAAPFIRFQWVLFFFSKFTAAPVYSQIIFSVAATEFLLYSCTST